MIVRGPEYALEDLKDNLASISAINDAMRFLQTLSGKPTPTLTDNLLDFVLHEKDGFDPALHFNNHVRFWSTMKNAFNETDLERFGITKESCATSSDKTAMVRTMLLATVIQSLEQKYIMADAENYDKDLQAYEKTSKAMNKEQEAHYGNLIVKIRAPFTRQDKRFADDLSELITIIDTTIGSRYQAIKDAELASTLQQSAAILQTSTLPVKVKAVISSTIEEARSLRNGLDYDECKYIISSINDFMTKPNEENRQALKQISDILAVRNVGANEAVTAISTNLFSLSLISVKSAASSTMYGSKEDKTPGKTPPDTPRLD